MPTLLEGVCCTTKVVEETESDCLIRVYYAWIRLFLSETSLLASSLIRCSICQEAKNIGDSWIIPCRYYGCESRLPSWCGPSRKWIGRRTCFSCKIPNSIGRLSSSLFPRQPCHKLHVPFYWEPLQAWNFPSLILQKVICIHSNMVCFTLLILIFQMQAAFQRFKDQDHTFSIIHIYRCHTLVCSLNQWLQQWSWTHPTEHNVLRSED